VEDRDEKNLARIREKDARLRHARADFEPGDRVAFLPDGVTGTIRVSAGTSPMSSGMTKRSSVGRESRTRICGEGAEMPWRAG
jgi:hypothetical protein